MKSLFKFIVLMLFMLVFGLLVLSGVKLLIYGFTHIDDKWAYVRASYNWLIHGGWIMLAVFLVLYIIIKKIILK